MFTDLQLARLCELVYDPAASGLDGYFADETETTEGVFFEQPDALAVVFRGTDEPADLLKDFDVRAVQWPFAGCWCHEGFYRGWKSVQPQVGERIMKASAEGKEIFIGGHSYGAVVAEDAAQEFGGKLRVFGKPVNGNAEFNRRLLHVADVRLYVNGKDLVTRHPWHIYRPEPEPVLHPVALTDIGSWWTRWTPPWGCVTGRHSMQRYVKAMERKGIA